MKTYRIQAWSIYALDFNREHKISEKLVSHKLTIKKEKNIRSADFLQINNKNITVNYKHLS